jgi:putative ABC transport system permease protein
MNLAYRNLIHDKFRLALSLAGVALSVMLILLLNGLLVGMNRQVTSYLMESPQEIIIAQEGVENLLGATSLLPESMFDEVGQITGVKDVTPILSQFIILDLHNIKQPAYLVGYNPAIGGGPWEMAEGRQPESDSELVFDRVLAERHEIRLGDSIDIMGSEFLVVGLSENTTSWMTSFFFMQKTAAENLLRSPGATSFLLVSVQTGEAAEEVTQRMLNLEGADALLKSTVAENDLKLFARVFSAPLQLMVGIAFLVGVLVVGLVIYTATVERQREYGTLKAMGASNSTLYRVVAVQALVSALTGALLGVLLAYGVGELIMLVRPQFLVSILPQHVSAAILAGLGMAVAAALFPARYMAGLAPAEVFRK